MGTISDKLNYLTQTKEAIMNAIIAKGVEVLSSDTFRSYADKIAQITGGGSGGGILCNINYGGYTTVIDNVKNNISASIVTVDNLSNRIVGSLYNNSGIVSGFNYDSYVNDGISTTLDSQSYYIKFRLKEASVPRQSAIIYGEYLLNLECDTSKQLSCYCWKTSTASTVLDTIEPNTWYYAIIRMEDVTGDITAIFKKYYISTISFEDALNKGYVVMIEDNKQQTATSYSTYYGRSSQNSSTYADAFEIDFNETCIMNNSGSVSRQYYQTEKLI